MENPLDTYESLLAKENLEDLADEEALEKIGVLVDLSSDLRRREGLEHAIRLSEKLQRRNGLSPVAEPDCTTTALTDTLSFSVYRYDFEAKTLWLLKMACAALVYLSLTVHREEERRGQNRDPEELVLQQESDIWDDEWKL